jgi:hypothetical protein
MAVVGELVAAGVSQHVRAHLEGSRGLAQTADEVMEADGRHWPAALGDEDVRLVKVLAP